MAESRRFPEGMAQGDEDAHNRAPRPSYPPLPPALSSTSLMMLQESLNSPPNTATPRPTTPFPAYLPRRAIHERTPAFLGSQQASNPMPPLEDTDFTRMQKDFQTRLTTMQMRLTALAGLVADAQELLQPDFGRTASQPPASWHNELCDRTLNKLDVASSILSEAWNEMAELYSAAPNPELDVDCSEAGWSTKCQAPDRQGDGASAPDESRTVWSSEFHMDLSDDEERDCPSPRAVLASQQTERKLAL